MQQKSLAEDSNEMSRLIFFFFLNKQDGHDGTVMLTWVSYHILIREPDLELIKANILAKIHNDYIDK